MNFALGTAGDDVSPAPRMSRMASMRLRRMGNAANAVHRTWARAARDGQRDPRSATLTIAPASAAKGEQIFRHCSVHVHSGR